MTALAEQLARGIGRLAGAPCAPLRLRETGGGCIHRAFIAETAQARWFVKINAAAALPQFEAEAAGLAALHAARGLRVPQPLGCVRLGDDAALVMECLDLAPLDSREAAIAFGRALASLHRNTGPDFGWPSDNFIGATPQANGAAGDWPHFFAERRLRPQLRLAASRGHGGLRDRGERLAQGLPALLLGHRPAPSLLHGDLWHGNAARLADGTPVVFDPAIYRGDRETDLAMSELFGGLPTAFYAAYREAWPLAAGYETRKTLYNLYHVLNHLNLFGTGYLRQAERMIDALLAELRG